MPVALCIEAPKQIVNRSCVDAVAIPKGTLCKLSGSSINTVNAATGTGEAFGGITVEEKTVSDGIVNIGCALDGVWDIQNSSAAASAIGTIVVMSGANLYRAAVAADLLTGAVVGSLEELGTASGVDRVRLRIIPAIRA